MFNDIANPFGIDAYDPTVAQTPVTSVYYKRMKLVADSARAARSPKPPSQILKNFLLTF